MCKYAEWRDMLSVSECSVEACAIILIDYNQDRGDLPEIHLTDNDISTANEVTLAAVSSVLKSMGTGIARGITAAVDFMTNASSKLLTKTKHAEGVMGVLNAAHADIGDDKQDRHMDSIYIAAFWPKSAVTDFRYIQTVMADLTGRTRNIKRTATGLTKILTSLNKCDDFSTLDAATEQLDALLKPYAGSSKKYDHLYGMIEKLKYTKAQYTKQSHQYNFYHKVLLFTYAKQYDTTTKRPLAIYVHDASRKEVGKTIVIPSKEEIKRVVTTANRSLANVIKAAKVTDHYGDFTTYMRSVHASIPSDTEVTKAAHKYIDGLYKIYRVICYNMLVDSVQSIELYGLLATAAIKEYK